jgi:quinol monooxygenase YgiN/quercetin dioxygenase-like cupin family protein
MLNLRSTILSFVLLLALPAITPAQDPVPLYPENYKVLLENDKVRVMEFQLRKGARENFHSHPAAVTYVLQGFKIRFTLPDGSTVVRETKTGDVFYGDAIIHSPENIGDTDARGLLIEMKSGGGEKSVQQMMGEGGLLTAVTFIRGLEGREEELKQELLALEGPTRAEPGCITYDLYQSPEKKNLFMRFEVWRSPEALEEHKQTPHLRASFEKRKQQGWTTEITTWTRVWK